MGQLRIGDRESERTRLRRAAEWKGAPWCAPCLALGPTIEELAGEYEGAVKVGKLDVDENPGVAGTYGVQSIPTVLLFKAGEVVQTFIGVQPKQHYEQALAQMID